MVCVRISELCFRCNQPRLNRFQIFNYYLSISPYLSLHRIDADRLELAFLKDAINIFVFFLEITIFIFRIPNSSIIKLDEGSDKTLP